MFANYNNFSVSIFNERARVTRNNLPEFEKPPLVEVALSVQYDPIPSFQCTHVGLLWKECFSDFPHTRQLPAIEPVYEKMGARQIAGTPRIELLTSEPSSRIWILNEQGDELIQVQQDRFIRNWRKISKDGIYPRYENHIKPNFLSDFTKFTTYLKDNEVGDVVPNQCEVTYINHLTYDGYDHSKLTEMISIVNASYNHVGNIQFEDSRLNFRNIILDEENHFQGRLHLNIEPAFRSEDDMPIAVLSLTARGKPLSSDQAGIEAFFDIGREHIVNNFKAITTKKMHSLWGMKP